VIVAIAGGPRTGKTTLGEAMALRSGTEMLSTDRLIALGWSEASQATAARMLTASADLIVEGVAVARALRKALGQTDGRPCDRLIVLGLAHVEVSGGQRAMAKGVDTVLAEILPELRRRGVEVA
jgi:adenylate kinase family enzyme